MDRRTTLKWVLSAAASWPALRTASAQTATSRAGDLQGAASGSGYGTDPALVTKIEQTVWGVVNGNKFTGVTLPEPSTGGLVLISAVGLLRRKRRR